MEMARARNRTGTRVGGRLVMRRGTAGQRQHQTGGAAKGERRRRSMLRRVGRGAITRVWQVEERSKDLRSPFPWRLMREFGTLAGARAGRRLRVGLKGKTREGRRRRVVEGYRRRWLRGRVGALIRHEASDRWERYLGRERRSLSTYARVGYHRGSGYATEAGRKYYRLGATASSRRVRGMWRVYGATGRVKLEERATCREGVQTRQVQMGRRRMVWVRRFKRGAFPAHRWVADVYEGAPTRAGRYRRRVPKLARRVTVSRRRGRDPTSLPTSARRRSARGSVTVGGRGMAMQRRWKRFRAYSGIGSVGFRRLGRRTSTRRGRRGCRVSFRAYVRVVVRRWGGRMSRSVVERTYEPIPFSTSVAELTQQKAHSERKYRTERRGRRQESVRRAMGRVRGRMSRLGRPPRVGFEGKRLVYIGRVEKCRQSEEGRYREIGGRAMLAGMVGVYGYVRIVKWSRLEASERFALTANRHRKRGVTKEVGRRRAGAWRGRCVRWRNGGGRERKRRVRASEWRATVA